MVAAVATRVPIDADYAALVGRAVYVFAYYEWTVIWIIERLKAGYVTLYARGGPRTSGVVASDLSRAIESAHAGSLSVPVADLLAVSGRFSELGKKRNALVHAHPATGPDGSQVLIHQASSSRALPDMTWPLDALVAAIREFDDAAVAAGQVLDALTTSTKTGS